MTASLEISFDRYDEPAALDPLERATSAAVRIAIGRRAVTALWDRIADSPRELIYVPVFPLARWFVTNWWAILHEPRPGDGPPDDPSRWSERDREWISRHALSAADSGAMLPPLRICGEGERVVCSWRADDPEAYPSEPGYFLASGDAHLARDGVEAVLGEFVSRVLSECARVSDPRVEALAENWRAITGADAEERSFCRAAGILGLDPYAIAEWPAGMAEFLESALEGDLERPFGRDFLEAVRPERAPDLWTPLSESVRSLALSAGRAPLSAPSTARRAKDLGYAAARSLRSALGLGTAPLEQVPRLMESLGFGALAGEDLASPDRGFRGAVGWHGRTPVLACSENRPITRRFLEARSVFLAALACGSGPRLLTNASTWDQAVSRAFAAELLAPQAGLERLEPDADWEEREAAITRDVERYQVDREVVRRQRENAYSSVA